MRKATIKTISILLIFAFSIIFMSSCGLIYNGPKIADGYTGGFGIPYYSTLEYWWVETYEECLQGIESLKAEGSTFQDISIFSYDGELFDTKYCFRMDRNDTKGYAKYGKYPFERRSYNVSVIAVAFLSDVTIDELVFDRISKYDTYCFFCSSEYESNDEDLSLFFMREVTDGDRGNYVHYERESADGRSILCQVVMLNAESEKLSAEAVDAIINSIEFIGFENEQ